MWPKKLCGLVLQVIRQATKIDERSRWAAHLKRVSKTSFVVPQSIDEAGADEVSYDDMNRSKIMEFIDLYQ